MREDRARVWVLDAPASEAGDVRAKVRPWFSDSSAGQTEFVRADIHEAVVEALKIVGSIAYSQSEKEAAAKAALALSESSDG